MTFSFSDFLSNNAVIIILLLLGGILAIAYYFKRKLFRKYHDIDNEVDQTPEEILQEELDQLLVTERYNPNATKKPKDILDEDDDIVEEEVVETTVTDEFEVNTDVSYSFPTYQEDDNNNE